MTLQSHIHLSNTLGSAPENAPNYKWRVKADPGIDRIPQFFISARDAINGKLRPQRLLTTEGAIFKRVNYRMQLLVRDYDSVVASTRIGLLEGWVGNNVYFVPHDHPNDGADHTASVDTLFFHQMSAIKADHIAFAFYYVDIELLDLG